MHRVIVLELYQAYLGTLSYKDSLKYSKQLSEMGTIIIPPTLTASVIHQHPTSGMRYVARPELTLNESVCIILRPNAMCRNSPQLNTS